MAAEAGGGVPAVLNAANEVAVAAFLCGKLAFTRIAIEVEQVLSRFVPHAPTSLAEVIAALLAMKLPPKQAAEHSGGVLQGLRDGFRYAAGFPTAVTRTAK